MKKAAEQFTIFHNPRCSKSRETLRLLEEHGVQPTVIEYLKTPPSVAELQSICSKLGIAPHALVRKGEDTYKTQFANRELSDAQWLTALHENPVLIERPVVVRGERAAIGRPPENVLQLLQ